MAIRSAVLIASFVLLIAPLAALAGPPAAAPPGPPPPPPAAPPASPPAAPAANAAVDKDAARAAATAFITALERGDAATIERMLHAPVSTSLEPLADFAVERRASKACARFEKSRTVQAAAVKTFARCLAERGTASSHHELDVTTAGARVRIESGPAESYMQSPDEEGVVLELERVRGSYRIRTVKIEQIIGGVAGGVSDDSGAPPAGAPRPPPPPPPPARKK